MYGVRKLWRALRREGSPIGRDRAGRLMATLGLGGVSRAKTIRTTQPGSLSQRPADLVERVFAAAAPNRLWVADLTYVWTVSGFCYAAFIVDAFSRRIVGWRVAASTLRTELALDALEMAIWARGDPLPGLVHHSDRGVQYLAIRYTERLADAGAVNSVGSKGDSYDNALAESVNALYKAELIRRQRSWRTVELTSSWPPPAGSTGGMTAGSIAPAATSHRPSSRQPMLAYRRCLAPLDSKVLSLHQTQGGSMFVSRPREGIHKRTGWVSSYTSISNAC